MITHLPVIAYAVPPMHFVVVLLGFLTLRIIFLTLLVITIFTLGEADLVRRAMLKITWVCFLFLLLSYLLLKYDSPTLPPDLTSLSLYTFCLPMVALIFLLAEKLRK